MANTQRNGMTSKRRGNAKKENMGWFAIIVGSMVCLVCLKYLGVFNPTVGGLNFERGMIDTRGQEWTSTLFTDVKVPFESVPISATRARRSESNTFDAQVAMCRLNRDTYFHEPYKYPMFKDVVHISRCNEQDTTTLTALKHDIDSNPTAYLEPSGFVFHMSRCGSTLTANLLGSSPKNLVYSESKPPLAVLGLCDSDAACNEEERISALRTIILAMGKTSYHDHLFFKFQSSQSMNIKYYRKAFPNTPWVFVYRDPVPVLMSLLGFKAGKAQSNAMASPCLRSKHSPPRAVANILGVSTSEAKRVPNERYCAAHLAALCQSALDNVKEAAAAVNEAGGTMVNYDTLPNAIVPLLRDKFRAPLLPNEEYRALEISNWYAKSRTVVYNFESDTKVKEEQASSQILDAASAILEPAYVDLREASLDEASVPEVLASAYIPPGVEPPTVARSPPVTDEEFENTPPHMRGLNRVVDPDAPSFMASSKWYSEPIEPFDCPDAPDPAYPKGFPVMDVINHWNPDDAEHVPEHHYLATCRFDYQRELYKAEAYSRAEKPFILYNIPSVDAAAERWSSPDYMEKIFGTKTRYATEHSQDNHFMYFNHRLAQKVKTGKNTGLANWTPPTNSVNLSYREWLNLALTHGGKEGEHWYFRVGDANNNVILKEMEIFQKPRGAGGNIFLREPSEQRGIHCRFGMPGVIAEAHFDGSRNMVAMVSGVRRWIMAHPNQCQTMYLLPTEHPSGRHSEVDWSEPDLEKYPEFAQTLVSEVLLKAGEVLYVPTQWFHYISNIGINAQCNSRSGVSMDYGPDLRKCGFGPQSKHKSRVPHA